MKTTNRIRLKKSISNPVWKTVAILFFLSCFRTVACSQCSPGYYQAQLNWDNLDYFHQNQSYGVTSPATGQPFVSNAMKTNQKYSLGTNTVTITTTIAAGADGTFGPNWGDMSIHTGEAGSYGTGDDLKLMGNGTVTLTFQSAVIGVKFSVYDIDYNQKLTVTALNGATSLNVTMAKVSGTNLTIAGSGTTSASATAGATTAVANSSSDGTANIDIAGPVTSITLTISQTGTKTSGPASGQEDGGFFISDITACVFGTGFPTNYYTPYIQPLTGQPSYFLAAADSNANVYMIDPVSGSADFVFAETISGANGDGLNSLAYDPVNHWLYYVICHGPGSSAPPGNRALKKYDFNTETISTVIGDLNAYNIPTYIQGVENAAAAFYNGSLYLGIEGTDAAYSTITENIIWRIDFDASGNPTNICQVFGTLANTAVGHAPDWGDFTIKNGTLVSHVSDADMLTNNNEFMHYNLQNESVITTYKNYPDDSSGQIGQIWNGSLYRIARKVAIYNENGTTGSAVPVVANSCSPIWKTRALDASCPFKPKLDFGDAPASYDPVALSPAAHQRSCNNATLRLGANWDREWSKTSSTNALSDGADEDGISTVTVMASTGVPYNHVQPVKVLNNTGAPVTLGGWLDYNANGVFDASEGVIVTVPSSASMQTISLLWSNITVAAGTPNTFLRIRLTSGSLTASNATGWYSDGEVEDYAVVSSNVPLGIDLLDFTAHVTKNKQVDLQWQAEIANKAQGFEIERSADNKTWKKIGWVTAKTGASNNRYELLDEQPLIGKSYYRLKLIENSGSFRFSDTKEVYLNSRGDNMILYPNPAMGQINILLMGSPSQTAIIRISTISGELMITRLTNVNSGVNKIPVDISSLESGTYIVELITGERLYHVKLAVIK